MGEAKELTRDGDVLRWGRERVPLGEVLGFREQFNGWSGRAWLEVIGPGWWIPIAEGYGQSRAQLREWFPNRPFDVDWADGRFPAGGFVLPPSLGFAVAVGIWLAASTAVSLTSSPAWGAATLLVGTYPLLRLRDVVRVSADGLRLGPVWAPASPWFEVDGVCAQVRGSRTLIWAETQGATASALVPTVLLPALRARLWRLGGRVLTVQEPGNDARYGVWRGPAAGVPWGVLLGVTVGCWAAPDPFWVMSVGFLVLVAHALLAALVEARASGWGAGAILYGTALYAVVLTAISLGAWL